MKKILSIALSLLLAVYFLLGANFALADSTAYVDTVIAFSQGLQKNGATIDPSRSDPTKALGTSDGVFVSLGYGGEIVLSFPVYVGGTLVVTVTEVTYGVYSEEKAEVWGSKDGSSWALLGTANNLLNQGQQNTHDTVFELGANCIKYVKLIDKTDSSLHADASDGFDLDAVSANYSEECPPVSSICNIRIANSNEAFVMNSAQTRANTGGNVADGSYGGNGGAGGTIVNVSGEDVQESATGAGGAGGAGGNAGDGGAVITGAAQATTAIGNYVNVNKTLIDRCACFIGENCVCSSDNIRNSNRAMVANAAATDASSGINAANGSYAGMGGTGGEISNSGKEGNIENSSTGTGGVGGNGAAGGLVQTGSAISLTTIINVINRNLTRILR